MLVGDPRRVRCRLVVRSLLLTLLLASPSGCEVAGRTTSPQSIRYRLEWSRGRTHPLPDGGWEVTNDLGYRVRLTRGFLVMRDVALVPCDPKPPPTLVLDSVRQWLGPRAAWAGHSGMADPSSTKLAQVESLTDLRPRDAGMAHPGAQIYCRAHYLVARADQAAVGLPRDLDMVDQSLFVEGTYQRTVDAVAVRFAIETAIANGVLAELKTAPAAAPIRLDSGVQSATIVVRRRLDSMFDGVDFAAMDERRTAREILQNLIAGVGIELELQS